MANIFLVGFMGSGKSTIGRNLCKVMRRRFFDTDDRIVEMAGKSISDIFKDEGEEYFRGLETDVLRRLPENGNLIVSCGGGMALRPENVELMKEKGKIIYLFAEPETILERVKRSNKRPILEGNKNIEFITELMSKRIDFYEACSDIKIVVDGKTIDEICDEIRKCLTL